MAFIQNFTTTNVDTVEEFIGFQLPFTLTTQNLSTNTLESTRANITSLLRTEKGERIFQPNLGINLRRHLFQQIGAETFVQIEEDVIEQIATWLPFLQVLDVTTSEDIENNLIRIGVKYSFKSSPQLQDSVQVQMNTGASY